MSNTTGWMGVQVVKAGARYKWFTKGGAKKEVKETTTGKAPRFYPADDVPVPRKSARTTHKVGRAGYLSGPTSWLMRLWRRRRLCPGGGSGGGGGVGCGREEEGRHTCWAYVSLFWIA